MIADFLQSTEAQGLEIHPDKTQLLTNQKTNRTRDVEVDGMHEGILPPEEKVKYLGQMITFVDQETTDTAQNPMRLVRTRQTSTGTNIPILLTTTITYGEQHEKTLRSSQRRMLRLKKELGEKDIRDDETSVDAQEEHSHTKGLSRLCASSRIFCMERKYKKKNKRRFRWNRHLK